MTIFRFALMRSMRKRLTLISLCAVPFAMVLFPPVWVSENGFGFSFYGLVILYAAFLLVRSIMTDRINKITVRIFAAPVTNFQYLFQNLLGFLLLLSIQIVAVLSLGAVLYGWEAAAVCKLMLGYILFAMSSIAFSLAWNSLFRSKEMSDGVFSVIISLMALLGGVFIPVSILPGILQKIGMLFPTYWLSSALLSVRYGYKGQGFWLAAVMLLLFTVIFLLFGSKRRLE